jgi:chromosome transmission fidelity protein 1
LLKRVKGKSLSLICGSLTWLREHKRKKFDDELKVDVDGMINEFLSFMTLLTICPDQDEPDWMIEHAQKEKRRVALQERQDLEERLAKVREKDRRIKERARAQAPLVKRRRVTADDQTQPNLDEGHFLLDDYESDDDVHQGANNFSATDHGLSAETQALMEKLGLPSGGPKAKEDAEGQDELKIFYCSRTHSQLSQFSNELRRVQLPPAIDPDPPDPHRGKRPSAEDISEAIKHLTLGARKNLCINPKVNKLGSATAINERCIDLQRSSTAAESKCPFIPTKEKEAVVNDFRDHVLASIRDIEDLGTVGRQLGICPYYASRPAVKPCEV